MPTCWRSSVNSRVSDQVGRFRCSCSGILAVRRSSCGMRYQRAELPLKLDGLAAAREFFAGCFAESDPARESLWVAHVDDRRAACMSRATRATRAALHFPLRTIIADAAEHGSAGIVLAHNHPSGDARPSNSDCRATRRLATAAEALDCTVLDHLVFAGERVHQPPAARAALGLAGLDLFGRRPRAGNAERHRNRPRRRVSMRELHRRHVRAPRTRT